jgi:hypothetical protein
MPGDIMQAQFALNPATAASHGAGQRTQVRFLRPVAMQVSWYAQGLDGQPIYAPTPIDVPGKYNFLQGARYRLKLTKIAGRPGVELYPTLEVAPGNHKTDAFLAHSSVPVEFTDEDFKQAAEGNYVVKVIYLPDPQFQDVAGTGTDEILSTRLEPGQDPIQEALRRGSILLIIRMGNIDQEAPNTPPLGAPGPTVSPHGVPPSTLGPTTPGLPPAPVQVPFWGMPQHGAVPPGGVPPGMVPPGAIPPGALPPGVVPPSIAPPSKVPPASLVPAQPLIPPAGKSPIVPPLPGPDASRKASPGTDGNKALLLPTPPVTPVSVPPSAEGTSPPPVLPPAVPSSTIAPVQPSLPPATPMPK